MASQVDICNIALGNVGCQQFIQSLDDPSQEARTCKVYYSLVLNKVLEDFPWLFARTFIDLQDVGSPLNPWLYRYRYPADCIHLLRVFPQGGATQNGLATKGLGVPMLTINDDANDAKAILCDSPNAIAEYTKLVVKTSLFSPGFVDAFSWLLSSRIATPLSADPKYAQAAAQAYRLSLAQAAVLSANESMRDPEGDCDLDAARNA